MRIKLAILEDDKNYLNHIITAFTERFSDKLEIYSFSDLTVAMETIETAKIDIFIASDSFEIDIYKIPKHCGFSYFVESMDIKTYKNQKAICKFQKADLLYKEILSIYSETVSDNIGLRLDSESNTKNLAFVSAGGGVGSSTAAVACAMYLAKYGKRVLYLNLEQFGSSNLYFSGQGQLNFSDVIYAVKSKKSNLAMKLESAVKQDESGVLFYDAANMAFDMREMSKEDYQRLFNELLFIGYDYIIFDMDFSLDKACIEHLGMIHNVVFVSDGTETSNLKFERALATLSIMDQQKNTTICNRISLMYNKYSNKTGAIIENNRISVLGGIPKYEYTTTKQLLQELVQMSLFEKFI